MVAEEPATRPSLAAALGALWRVPARRIVDLLLPPACMACSKPIAADGALCGSCWGGLRLIERPFCQQLAIPFAYDLGPDALSAEAIADPPPFARLRAVAVYDGLSGRIIQALKYHDRTETAGALGAMMARAAAEMAGDIDLVLPVPLHRRRLWQRRFNQSAMLAEAIAGQLGLRYAADGLQRIKATRRQVGLKARERAANVQGAFRVAAASYPLVAGRRILLVDDVYTTGATVKAATRALMRAGASAVDVVVFARVVEGLD